jgi:hypothetical protein
MANVTGHLKATLDEFEAELAPIERRRNELITTINVIRAKAGLPPRPGGGGGLGGESESADSKPGAAKIRSDTFVGKRLRSAAKEYLSLRRSQGLDGPATPREIYDAIMSGGFEFEAKDETTRLISLRNTLRKRTEVFKRFDNGKYGLVEWYGPHIKKPKAANATTDDAEDEENETATSKKVAAS